MVSGFTADIEASVAFYKTANVQQIEEGALEEKKKWHFPDLNE